MGASDHFRRSVHACSRRFYAHPRIGIGSKKTGPREYREGNFPLSPFRYVMFPKHLISRARATRFNAERYPNHSFFRVHGGIRYKSAHPPALQRFCFHLFFSGRGRGRCSLLLRRSLSLSRTRWDRRFGGCARGPRARRRLAGVKNPSQCCPEKYCVDRLAPIMEDKRDPAESAIKPRRMRGPDFYCAVYGQGSAIFETYATSAK